jgi:hypothetical protein
VDVATLELTGTQAAAMGLLARPDVAAELRAVNGGAAIGDPTRERVLAASAVGLLKVPGDSLTTWLHAGRALQRVWLAATRLGLSYQPMTVLLYMFEMLDDAAASASVFTPAERTRLKQLQQRLDDVFDRPGPYPAALLFRLARAPRPTVRSQRLPPDWVLVAGPPPKAGAG